MDALTCALAALLLAGAGGPGHQLSVAVQDDALLLNRSPEVKAPADHPEAVVAFGQVRGARVPQVVHVARKTRAPAPGSPSR
jgi:hypothetical protein